MVLLGGLLGIATIAVSAPPERIRGSIDSTKQRGNRLTADPVGRTLIRNSESPATGTGSFSLRVAAISERTGSGVHDYSGPACQRRLQRNLHIADNFDLASHHFRENLANNVGDCFASGTGGADAGTLHLPRIDFRSATGLPYYLMQRFACARFSHADNVAGTGDRRREDRGFVANDTFCLAAAAVNAQIVGHGIFLSQALLTSRRWSCRTISFLFLNSVP